MTLDVDVAIVGAGIAGASVAHFLGTDARVALIEAESQPGYHTTGRSAAFYAETYGGAAIQPLTTASKSFFESPPAGFASAPLLAPRGGLHVARAGREAALDALLRDYAGSGVAIERLCPDAIAALVPTLRPEWRGDALWEPDCRDINVAALHQGFLGGAKRAGATLLTDAPVRAIERSGARWRLDTPAGSVTADVIVDAAGAWADVVAALAGVAPLGLQPMRRTVATVAVEPAADPALPLVIDADGGFYFKPDAARLWISPHDETPVAPSDVRPDELDVAIAIDRVERATTYHVTRVERAWAGLRTFTPTRTPAYGFDAEMPGFFWCAGQGGFGIQTAPAAGSLCAALLLGRECALPGVDPARSAPGL